LVAFLTSIATAISRESDAHAKVFEGTVFPEVRTAVIRAHRAVTDAVVCGDADAAKRRMERHLNAYAATVAETQPGEVDVE
jgi:DNA-binding GntR family transcriptional regulator